MTTLNATTTPTLDYGLGQKRSEHRITGSRAGGQFIGGLLLMGMGGVCIAIAGANRNANPTLAVIFTVLGFLFIGVGIWTLRSQKQEQELAFFTFQDGLVYAHHGQTDIIRWDAITEVYLYIYANRKARRTRYEYKLCGADGSVIKFNYYDHVVSGMKQMSDMIQQDVTRRQLPKMAAAYDAGQSISFGPLSVSKDGLGKGNKMLPWPEVEDVQMSRGYITIRKRNKRSGWAEVPVGKVSNISAFLALTEQIKR